MSLIKVLAAIPIVGALGACAPSSFVANKSELLTTEQNAASEDHRIASVVPIRHVAAHKGSTEPHIAKAQGASFGVASFYTEGTKTANGEKFDPSELTAASPNLPFGTRLRVTNVTNGRSVVVRVNDRGPFVPGRVVDVSYSAAETLGMVGRGTAKVKLDVVQ
ncbi:MAG: septal ring lytic transglycosylase RlpA family protein [Xanthobacteraceae bacterium]